MNRPSHRSNITRVMDQSLSSAASRIVGPLLGVAAWALNNSNVNCFNFNHRLFSPVINGTMADIEENTHSPFLRLPPELRSRIFEYLWPGTASLEVIVSSKSTKLIDKPVSYKDRHQLTYYNSLATLSVAKAVREEALLVFYERARFHVRVYEGNLWPTVPLAESEEVLRHIRNVKLTLSLPSRPHYYKEGVHDRLLAALRHLDTVVNGRARSQPLSVCVMSAKQVTPENLDMLRQIRWGGGVVLEIGFAERTQAWDETELGQIMSSMGQILKDELKGSVSLCDCYMYTRQLHTDILGRDIKIYGPHES